MPPRRKRKDRIPVWIVDDNKSLCVILAETLNDSRIVECHRYFHVCKTALRALAAADSPPCAVLLDIKMPKMSGLDAIYKIKQISPATQVIMLTSYDFDENIQTALDRGATGYLLKSSSPSDILEAIQRSQSGDVSIDRTISQRMISSYLGHRKKSLYPLTEREREVLQEVTLGLSSLQIAASLCMSYYTVETHIKNIFQKLQVHTRHGLVAKASKEQII